MKIISSAILLFISIISIAQAGSASGYVKDIDTHNPLPGAEVKLCIIVKRTGPDAHRYSWDSTYFAVDSTIADSAGRYSFLNIRPGRYLLMCFYEMPSASGHFSFLSEITRLGRYDTDSPFVSAPGYKYKHDFFLMSNCQYDKTKNQVSCPQCKKSDMVKPILWGLPAMNRDGKYFNDSLNRGLYYLGGCSPDIWCNPTRHCGRCDLAF